MKHQQINIKLKNNLYRMFTIIISLIFLHSIDGYFKNTNLNNSIWGAGLFLASFQLIEIFWKMPGRLRKYSYTYFLLYAFGLVVGNGMYSDGVSLPLVVPFTSLMNTVGGIISFSLVLCGLFGWIVAHATIILKKREISDVTIAKLIQYKYSFWILLLIQLILYIPVLLAYYPGVYSYDTIMQTSMAMKGIKAYTRFHPPLHTLIWSVCLHTAPVIHMEAVTIYAIGQMVFLSVVTAKLLCYIAHSTNNDILVFLSTIWMLFNPALNIFSIIITKDILFGGFLVLAAMRMKDCLRSIDYKHLLLNHILFGIDIVLACLFRNNAIYAYIGTLLLIVFAYRKYYKKVLLLFGLPIILFYFINGPFYSYVGIAPGMEREKLSVPMQQIARVSVLRSEELTSGESNTIEQFFPENAVMNYNPRFADPVKRYFNEVYYKDHKEEFFYLWGHLLKRFPGEYIDAFLNLHLPYWYPDADPVDPYSERIYIETQIFEDEKYMIQRNSMWPGALRLYEAIADYSLVRKIPIINKCFSISAPIWGLLGCIFAAIYNRKKEAIIILCLYSFLVCTFFLGPVSNLRYIYPVILGYPLFISLCVECGCPSNSACQNAKGSLNSSSRG